MTPHGKAYVLAQLADCHDLEALRRVWHSIANEYQKDKDVLALKDMLKESMK